MIRISLRIQAEEKISEATRGIKDSKNILSAYASLELKMFSLNVRSIGTSF